MKRRYKLGFIARPREQQKTVDNLVKNGGFDDDSFWTISNGVGGSTNISEGELHLVTSDGSYTHAKQDGVVPIGQIYNYSIDVTIRTGGVTLSLGDNNEVCLTTSVLPQNVSQRFH